MRVRGERRTLHSLGEMSESHVVGDELGAENGLD